MEFLGLILVLCFAILTIWTRDRWPISGMENGIFGLAILGACRCGFLGVPWPLDRLQLPLALTVIWGLLQLIGGQSIYRFATWSAVLEWLSLFFAFSVGVQLFANPALRHRFRIFAAVFGGAIALWAILQLFSAEGKILWFYSTPESDAPMGPFLNYDHYSAFIELLLPIALWEALTDRRRAVLYGGCAAVMYASVIAGTSRAGAVIATLEVGAVLIPAFTRKASARGETRLGLRIGLLALMFSAVVGWNELLKRFQLEDPFAARREAWIAGLAMIRERPWFGFGLGTWTTAYPRYAVFDAGAIMNAAHNDWLQWSGDGGLLFGMLMLIVALRAVYLGVKAPWGLGVAFVLLHCLVDFPLQKPPVFLWLVIVLAALSAGSSDARGRAVRNGLSAG